MRSSVSGPLLLALCLPALAGCGREVQTDTDAVSSELPRLQAGVPGTTGVAPSDGAAAATSSAASYSVLYSERDAELRARTGGVVVEVALELGDSVRAGQLLARLDDGEEDAAVAAAEAARELAEVEHARIVPLREADLIEAAELDRAVYRLRAATAELDRARTRLGYTRIRAPFDGVVSRRFIRLAETVKAGDPLFRVTALRPLRVRLMVPEAQALALDEGREAVLVGAAGTATARIARIAPAVDPAAGTVEVLLDVPRPGALRPGAGVRVEWPVPVNAAAAGGAP